MTWVRIADPLPILSDDMLMMLPYKQRAANKKYGKVKKMDYIGVPQRKKRHYSKV